MTKSFSPYILLLLALMVLLAGCHKKDTKASKHIRKFKHSDEAITVSEEEPFNFNLLDTTQYYLGEVGDSTYFFKIDKISQKHFSGRYYSVNTTTTIAEAHPFTITYQKGNYKFKSESTKVNLKFDIVVDTASISGVFSTSISGYDKQHLAFEAFQNPVFKKYESKRYAANCPKDYLNIEVQSDVVYGNAKGHWTSMPIRDNEKMGKLILKGMGKALSTKNLDLTMDIYLPVDTLVKKRPLLVLFHGGAFYFGDKAAETSTTWCKHFAQIGYVVASVNYRMGFNINKTSIQKSGYQAIQDAHAALRYLVANADKYAIDPDNIFIGGTSAGAITALGVTFISNSTCPPFVHENNFQKKLGTLESSGNKLKNTFKIKGVANMWGAVYELEELNGHNIPVISFHGTADNIVPFDEGIPLSEVKGNLGELLFDKMYGSKAIHHHLDSLHIRNEFYPIEGVSHAPYQDKHGHPNDCYFFIQDKMQRFFYKEMAHIKGITHSKEKPQHYYLKQNDVTFINWQAEGGFIMESAQNGVTVIWRKDAKQRKLTASGMRANGMSFTTSMNF